MNEYTLFPTSCHLQYLNSIPMLLEHTHLSTICYDRFHRLDGERFICPAPYCWTFRSVTVCMAPAVGSIGVGSPGATPALADGGDGRSQVEGEAVVCIGGSHGDCSLKRQQPGLVETLTSKVWPLCFLLFGTNVQSGPF